MRMDSGTFASLQASLHDVAAGVFVEHVRATEAREGVKRFASPYGSTSRASSAVTCEAMSVKVSV